MFQIRNKGVPNVEDLDLRVEEGVMLFFFWTDGLEERDDFMPRESVEGEKTLPEARGNGGRRARFPFSEYSPLSTRELHSLGSSSDIH